MFKRTYRKEAQQRLRSAVDKYENVCKSLERLQKCFVV
jgi:hypothetical protein